MYALARRGEAVIALSKERLHDNIKDLDFKITLLSPFFSLSSQTSSPSASSNSSIMFTPFLPLLALASAREISFPPVSGYTTADQVVLGGYNNPDISQPKFAGLATYANLPYVHCLAKEGEEVEAFDIAVLGAPFDTVS